MDNLISKYFYQSIAFVFLCHSSVVYAVEPRVYQLGDSGAIAPHVRLQFGSDSNPLRSDEGSGESLLLRVEPSVSYLVRRRNNELELSFEGDLFQYFEEYCQAQDPPVIRPGDCLQGSPTFNKASYFDQELSLDGSLEISRRLRAELQLSRSVRHQPLGTGLSAIRSVLDVLTEPEAFINSRARALVSFGAPRARGEIQAGITFLDRDFDTERDDPLLDELDERRTSPDIRLLYRIGTRTQLFAGLGSSTVRGGNSERDITRQTIGAEFDASSITSGSISFSNETEDFLGNQRDVEFFGFEVELTWRPRTFSTVEIRGNRQSERGLFDEDISLSTRIGADWTHFWRERFSTSLGLTLQFNAELDEFTTLDPDNETNEDEDDIVLFEFVGNYNIRRWLDIGGFVTINTRDGFGDARDFERTLIGVTANGTF